MDDLRRRSKNEEDGAFENAAISSWQRTTSSGHPTLTRPIQALQPISLD